MTPLSKGSDMENLTGFVRAILSIFLSSAAVGLALVSFIAVMRYVDKDSAILVYARRNLLISLAGASALYVVLVALMTWVLLIFMKQ